MAAGGTSYRFDRILARPFSGAAGESTLMTRGRALYMYTHNPRVLGFVAGGSGANGGGGYAYRQPPTTGAPQSMYTVAVTGDALVEDTTQRVQYPSYFSSVYSNKAFGSGGNTYREPAAYTVRYFDGSSWVDVPNQVAVPATPAPNLNQVTFAPIVARQLRVLVTRATGYAVGIKELQVFDTRSGYGE